MIQRGFLPTVVTYNALIQGLCDFSRLDEANKLLKHMIDVKVYPDVQTYTILVDSFCKDVLIKDAEDVVQICYSCIFPLLKKLIIICIISATFILLHW